MNRKDYAMSVADDVVSALGREHHKRDAETGFSTYTPQYLALWNATYNQSTIAWDEAYSTLRTEYNVIPGDHADKMDGVFGALHPQIDEDLLDYIGQEFDRIAGEMVR